MTKPDLIALSVLIGFSLLLLGGCSSEEKSPKTIPPDYAQNFWLARDHERDIKAIKHHIMNVDTGCRFETQHVIECINEDMGCMSTAEGTYLGKGWLEKDEVKTVCKGDQKIIDAYDSQP